MRMGIEAICAGMDGDEDRIQRGRLGMDFKYAGTDGDWDKLLSPRSSLVWKKVSLGFSSAQPL